MKDLMTTKNMTYVALGLLTAIVVYKVIVNKDKKKNTIGSITITTEDKSSFCGCGA